jgi:predicted RNase H-like nuclease (RuvC/YqgF family)
VDTGTRAAIAALGESTNAGFARIERYIELQRAEFLEWREEARGEFAQLHGAFADLRGAFADLRERVDALTERVARLEHEVMLLRDYVTREISAIRLELRELRARSDQTDELRREIAELTVRVDHLEQRQPD